ncbi:thiamine phosphate synthase [Coraliomargarita sp. W4R72]
MSPVSEYANEADVIVRLLQAGLARYHVRKPMWSVADCAALLDAVPREWHARMSIHQHHVLARSYAVGIHFKDGVVADDSLAEMLGAECRVCSRSLHNLEGLEGSLHGVDYAFLSPVFQSISKHGYGPAWTEAGLRVALSGHLPAKLYALGGITAVTAARVSELGFEGVVLHGSLWQAVDPLAAFYAFRKEVA